MTGYGIGMFRGSGWGGQGGLQQRGRGGMRGRQMGGFGGDMMRPAVGIGGGDSYQSITGKPFPQQKNPPALGAIRPNRQTGIGMAPGTFQPQTGGGSPYEPGGEMPMEPGGSGFGRLNPGFGGGGDMAWAGGSRRFNERSGQYGGGGYGGGYGRSPSPYGSSRFAPGGQFGDFDMSSIFGGIGDPYSSDPYNYGAGPETDYAMPWETSGGGEEEGGGAGTGEVYHGTEQQQNGGPDGGQNGRDAWGGSGRGPEVGSFGDWAGRMGNMARDLWSGDYSRDSDYGSGNQSAPGAQDAAQAQAEATQGPDFQANGGVPRRRFEGGGGADGADVGDMRGQGRDQAADPSWNDFSGGWGKVIDMASVGPMRGFAEVTGIADKVRDGLGWGGIGGTDMGPSVAGGGGYGGAPQGPEMGAGMNARGGPIRRSMGGIGYAEGGDDRAVRGEGDGRSDEIPALLSNGEHVIPADVVAAMGRGSTDAGHKALNDLILKKRAQFRKTLGKLPPPKG